MLKKSPDVCLLKHIPKLYSIPRTAERGQIVFRKVEMFVVRQDFEGTFIPFSALRKGVECLQKNGDVLI